MTHSELFTGASGRIFSASILAVIIGLMLAMSLALYRVRRKKAYFSFSVSLAAILAQYILILIMEFGSGRQSVPALYAAQALKVFSFILINLGIFQLYKNVQRKTRKRFAGLVALTLLLAVWHYALHGFSEPAPFDQEIYGNPSLDVYLFLLTLLFYRWVVPWIGEQEKYKFALRVFVGIQIVHALNAYFFATSPAFFLVLENFLPAVFYTTVFLIFLNRLVEVLQTTYESSITDGLTGLYNRRFFTGRVTQCLKHGLPVSILFADIDNFKNLNDTEGHLVGDDMIRLVAKILREESEEIGIAGRYGGEEMVVLVTDPSIDVRTFAEYIRTRIETESIVTVSLGYSKARGEVSAEQLIKQADLAMYRAKQTGKNKTVAYRPGLSKQA